MAFGAKASFSKKDVAALKPKNLKKGINKAMRRAKATSLRTMKSGTKKRIRKRKSIKAGAVDKSIKVEDNKQSDIRDMVWGVRVRGKPRALINFPWRQLKKGISVMVNKGERTRLPHAFIQVMKSGHVGIFQRRHPFKRNIWERLGSRPVDAMMHKGEADAVREAGREAFIETARRNMIIEMNKL